jgi:hypothetical protein
MEKQNVKFIVRDTHIGQMLAGVYALAAFGLTAFAIVEQAYWVAGILGGGTIVSGVIAFLRNSQSKNKSDQGSN